MEESILFHYIENTFLVLNIKIFLYIKYIIKYIYIYMFYSESFSSYTYFNLCILQLKNALTESHKNASLLAEYHDLYELQRRRLQGQVQQLSEEREIWSTAAYSLALKVNHYIYIT